MFKMKTLCYYCFICVFIWFQIDSCAAQEIILTEKTLSESVLAVNPSDLVEKKASSVELPVESTIGHHSSIEHSPSEQLAVSIKCYQCNSYKDPDCIHHPERFELNCTNLKGGSSYRGCWKIDQWVDYDASEATKAHHRVIRQCASEGDASKPCYYRAGFGGRINACYCESNLCNSARTFTLSSIYYMQFLLTVPTLITAYAFMTL